MVHLWLGNDILQMSANMNIRCLPVARRGNYKNRDIQANYFNCCTSRVHLLICIMDVYFDFDYHIDQCKKRKFEDTKGTIRSHNLKKDRVQWKTEKDKKTKK